MTDPHDICLKIYVTPELYLGLKHRATEQDRTLSQHLRHLIRVDLHQACVEEAEEGRAEEGPGEGRL